MFNLKPLSLGLIFLLAWLMLALFWQSSGVMDLNSLKKLYQTQQTEIAELKARNKSLESQIHQYRQNPQTIESLARYELGLVKSNETFYQLVYPIEEGK